MGIGDWIERGRHAEGLSIGICDADNRFGMGIDHQLDDLAGQFIRHLEVLALVGHGAVLADLAPHPVIKDRIQLRRLLPEQTDLRQVLLIAGQRRFTLQPAMGTAVIDLFDSGPNPRIEIVQIVKVGHLQFAEKVVAEGAMPAL